MTKVFNNLNDIQKYYNKETNTYNFRENSEIIDVVIFNFDLNIESNIEARDLRATSIAAKNIHARNITVWEIKACDIESVCIDAGVISARDIYTTTIKSMSIYARDIKTYGIDAVNIYARDILYTTMCIAYEDFKCNSIKCRQELPIHCSLYGKLEVLEDE